MQFVVKIVPDRMGLRFNFSLIHTFKISYFDKITNPSYPQNTNFVYRLSFVVQLVCLFFTFFCNRKFDFILHYFLFYFLFRLNLLAVSTSLNLNENQYEDVSLSMGVLISVSGGWKIVRLVYLLRH